ncbi:uncharacterized protein LOC135386422 [Ornithodoros turicata]|uniref:uncharacterized protein LOC135386422 n=1 Tax=Ornithodoros turicata TaxID=34597 RepID=UPI003138B7E9
MSTVTCLVTIPHVDVRRKCRLEDGALSALRAAIAGSSILAPYVEDSDRFPIFDADFNQYVELDECDEIPDMSTDQLGSMLCSTSAPATVVPALEPEASTSGAWSIEIVTKRVPLCSKEKIVPVPSITRAGSLRKARATSRTRS